ncbi:MAG: nitroreductase [Nocardioides sp.]|uniref:nitroreductase n=1 Tax=Nocardioides sp. TaxID=35761 RepID=UPI0039E28FAA
MSGAESQFVDRLLAERQSCRGFLPDPLERAEIAELVAAASHAPSWCNTQPWELIITDGEETERFRKALRAHAETSFADAPDMPFPPAYEGVYRDRRRECGWQLYQSLGIDKGDRVASGLQMLENFSLFGAPHVAVVTTDRRLGTYGALDCGLFVQSFLLAAQSRGIGTIAQAAIASQAPFVREHFDIPEDRLVLLGISFGRPDPDHPANGFRTRRAGVEEIVTWADGALRHAGER